ncbi:hypothetical protein CBR_g200 [Chara braunii]|uniref:PRA1 family protein n=1 Tax=Chara braunii TaxID=69332 RepID=A0A388JLV0_CHABU|nr:hypothetical protein CBR_g200 [Chara braunii]|eukprot:GBG58800.1 hypothetical protein CBR_g200 [Chara braunii]
MDWGNVTAEELVEALREVEWSAPPRPLSEFFAKFTPPKNQSKWKSRLKCNFYYYRTNYFILLLLVLGLGFLRNPLALVAVGLAALSAMCLNDTFALSLSEKITREARRISPPLAAKMRSPPGGVGMRSRYSKKVIKIAGQDRRVVVAALTIVSVILWYLTSAMRTVCGSLAIGLSLSLFHASFRSPNLKAYLNSFREEFRAGWRGYSDAL